MLQQYNSTYHAKPRSIYFLPQYQRQRKYITQLKKKQDVFPVHVYFGRVHRYTCIYIYIYIFIY